MKVEFGDKAKLVAAVSAFAKSDLWVDRVSKKKGHERDSNRKLLRLHRTFSEVRERFGTRAKLIDAICELGKRAKDAGFRKRLEAHPVPRLFDAWKSAARRAGVAIPKIAAPKPSVPKAEASKPSVPKAEASKPSVPKARASKPKVAKTPAKKA
jgi:hypothetical protein